MYIFQPGEICDHTKNFILWKLFLGMSRFLPAFQNMHKHFFVTLFAVWCSVLVVFCIGGILFIFANISRIFYFVICRGRLNISRVERNVARITEAIEEVFWCPHDIAILISEFSFSKLHTTHTQTHYTTHTTHTIRTTHSTHNTHNTQHTQHTQRTQHIQHATLDLIVTCFLKDIVIPWKIISNFQKQTCNFIVSIVWTGKIRVLLGLKFIQKHYFFDVLYPHNTQQDSIFKISKTKKISWLNKNFF